jgi:hypothetical protein
MGIKMSKVLHNEKELKIQEYDTNKKYNQLKCYYCGTDVSFVDSYERDLGDRKITVGRFFRLKKGHEHHNGCKFTVDGEILNIYAACADNEIILKQDDAYVVRLLLTADDTRSITNSTIKEVTGHGKRDHNYISSGKKTAYLSTMKRIMQLRTMVESNNDLANKIKLQFRDYYSKSYFILWKNFYFDSLRDNDYSSLLKYLKGKKIYHPICIDGFIKSVNEYQPDKYCLKLEPVKIKNDETKRVAVTVYFDNSVYDLCKGIEGKRMVIYGKYKFDRMNDWASPDGKVFYYYNIVGQIYDKNQVYLVDSQ